MKCKYFIDLVERKSPNSHVAVIGNKQDIEGALSSDQISSMLALPAYPMVAVDENNRMKMVKIISDILDVSADASPQLKPLMDREKQLYIAEQSLLDGDFNKAAKILEEIADLCIDLGEDRLFQEFQKNADKIRRILSNIENVSSLEEGQTILLVDDEEAVRHILKRILENGGFRVLLANNGVHALDLYKETLDSIDIVVVDLLMPEMGGIDTISQLRKIRPELKAVYISGYPGEEEKLLDEVDNFLSKPIRKEDLLKKVKNLLETSSN
jgi:CheY-like chemotaxis protein